MIGMNLLYHFFPTLFSTLIQVYATLFGLPELPVLPPSVAEKRERMRGLPVPRTGRLAALLHLLLFRYDGYTKKALLISASLLHLPLISVILRWAMDTIPYAYKITKYTPAKMKRSNPPVVAASR
jgi:hypothetical protein